MAAYYYNQEEMQHAYTAFAEEVFPVPLSTSELKRMHDVHLNLHKGLHAFQKQRLKQARQYFWDAIKTGPLYCKAPWIWSKLFLTFVGRTKWGIMYK